jgi:hypothetical protein
VARSKRAAAELERLAATIPDISPDFAKAFAELYDDDDFSPAFTWDMATRVRAKGPWHNAEDFIKDVIAEQTCGNVTGQLSYVLQQAIETLMRDGAPLPFHLTGITPRGHFVIATLWEVGQYRVHHQLDPSSSRARWHAEEILPYSALIVDGRGKAHRLTVETWSRFMID